MQTDHVFCEHLPRGIAAGMGERQLGCSLLVRGRKRGGRVQIRIRKLDLELTTIYSCVVVSFTAG